MKHYCSSENYLALDEIEKILSCDDVKIEFNVNLSSKSYTIHAYMYGVFLGKTRALKKIPKHLFFPRISVRACSNRVLVENFGG